MKVLILIFAFSTVLNGQSKITSLEHSEAIDSFQVGENYIYPGTYPLEEYKTIYVPAKANIILSLYDNTTHELISTYFEDTLEYGKYKIDFEEVFKIAKSGVYKIKLEAVVENNNTFPEKIIISRKVVFIL